MPKRKKKQYNITEICEFNEVPRSTYYYRLRNGYSPSEAATGINIRCGKEKPAVDHKGKEYTSILEMCKAYGVSYHKFNERLKKGYTLESALTGKNIIKNRSKEVKDFNGKKFESESAMCRHWHVNISTYKKRLKLGYSLKGALTGDNTSRSRCDTEEKRTDHHGVVYQSTNKMCVAYGIGVVTYRSRLKRGLTVEEALTEPVKSGKRKKAEIEDIIANG